jgi:hypothetical protein
VALVPLLPTPLSARMLTQLQQFIAQEGWTDLALLPFFCMVDRRRSLHRELIGSAGAGSVTAGDGGAVPEPDRAHEPRARAARRARAEE